MIIAAGTTWYDVTDGAASMSGCTDAGVAADKVSVSLMSAAQCVCVSSRGSYSPQLLIEACRVKCHCGSVLTQVYVPIRKPEVD